MPKTLQKYRNKAGWEITPPNRMPWMQLAVRAIMRVLSAQAKGHGKHQREDIQRHL
jgi:hypothetical protein